MQQPASQLQTVAKPAQVVPQTTTQPAPPAKDPPQPAVVAKSAVVIPDTPAQPAPVPTLQDLLNKFIQIKVLSDPSSHFTHEGICTKCGWHTMQLSEKAAQALAQQHVQQHWRDVAPQVQR